MKLLKFTVFIVLLFLNISRTVRKAKSKATPNEALTALNDPVVMRKFDSDVCGITAEKIFELLADGNITKTPYRDIITDGMPDQEATKNSYLAAIDGIPALLDAGKLVKVETLRDHHFVLLKTQNSNLIYIWQSFSEAYHLSQWIGDTGINSGAYLTAAEIVTHLKKIINETKTPERLAAQKKLFSPDELQGSWKGNAQTIVVGWYADKVRIPSIWNANLARTVPNTTFMDKLKACFCCGKK